MPKPTTPSVKATNWADTHEVFNQVAPLAGHNLYAADTALRQAVQYNGGHWAEDDLQRYGEVCGRPEMIQRGFDANEFPPIFEPHDRVGNRVDLVRYHPAYHQLMQLALSEGLHSSPWTDPKPGAHVARAAKYYLHCQLEAGHGCPVTMTFAAVPSIRLAPALAEEWLPKITNRGYDPSNRPYTEKTAVTIGMGMTEKQGGSDVRANTTTATPLGDGCYELVGHKWFTSAPMCDAFLMLARTDAGLSCFLVPRWRPDGSKNPVQIQRLKNKAGNVSNASSEIELRGALGWLVGEEGRGINAIIEMVAVTRFDCMIGSAGGQRQAVAQAIHHASQRSAFGKRLIDQPLMQNVLADLQLEVEGSVALTMRMARAFDHPEKEHERMLMRLGAAVGKYWICKRTPHHAYEAMECLGGNGVIEDFITARLYRDAPINAIWEGSGNIQALDVLRAAAKMPATIDHWFDELADSTGADPLLDRWILSLKNQLADSDQIEFRARQLADQLALAMQAHLLIQGSSSAVAEAFIASRLSARGAHSTGTLPKGLDVATLIERGNPQGNL
ncbi:acyl-CoA dehydrogenase family protein [Microbulbifer thermotolerans]|uniref:acyl-CoA dehydrogenase family protein n=1 Tax=Microbulbifer thermotolerans TaxID=252514 RepID=UPI00224A6680|nr:acyl-CoA dehydrogenase family protein [Microbulbifer thermotolerans]MCX2841450.1 acyl-CoA dehydrogenase family protein [Microbulbifer thermotolerans]